MGWLVFAGVIALLVCGWWLRKVFKQRRIARLLATPIPGAWKTILQNRVPLYSRLPAPLQQKLHGRINLFLDHLVFVGCDDQQITDDVRLTIAANACLLLINRHPPFFTGFQTILVYPDTYVANHVSYDGLVVTRSETSRLGESWHRGPVVLSWSDVLHGSENPEDGHNVVIHEFAHKLDEENTHMDGLPVLRERADYPEWAAVLTEEFDAFRDRVKHHKNSVIDDYGAVSAAEFFAVISETFFEKPQQMKNKLPALYQQLSRYYDLDPASWNGQAISRSPE